MNYKELKKQIKVIVASQQNVALQVNDKSNDNTLSLEDGKKITPTDTLNNDSVQTALADFFFKIDRHIEKVESFYTFQFTEYERRLKRVTTVINSNNKDGDKIEFDKEEFEEVIGILVELRANFRNLKWFGELNKRGFIKILKKLDKKTGTNKQMSYLSSRVFPLSFANESEILRVLGSINNYLGELSPQADELISLTNPQNNYESYSNNSSQGSAVGRGYISPTSNRYASFIKKNDGNGLIRELVAEYRSPILAPSKLLINLLNKSALAQSFDCIDKLLNLAQNLSDSSDISARNFFHHHVIALGKQTAKEREEKRAKSQGDSFTAKDTTAPENTSEQHGLVIERDMSLLPAAAPDSNFRLVGAYGSDGINSNDSPSSLEYILTKLPTSLRPSLLQRDNYKRAPLHYAAQFGLKDTAKTIINYLKKWNQWDSSVSIDDVSVWGDTEYLTPLHLSLVANHPLTTKVLLDSMNPEVELTNPALLLLAARLKSPKLLENLLNCKGIDINYAKKDTGETALYISTKLDSVECVEFLLQKGADTEIRERIFGWTPIFIAASEGYEKIVEKLVAHGAEYSKVDESGWLPMEHASLRGHLSLAELVRPKDYDPLKLAKSSNLNKLIKKEGSDSPGSSSNASVTSLEKTLNNQESTSSIDKLPNSIHQVAKDDTSLYKEIKLNGANQKQSPAPFSQHSSSHKPIKSFGHQFLKNGESLVLLTLGTTDLRDDTPAIKLNRVPISKAHSTELDTALSVCISCKQLKQPPVVLDLPLDDSHGSATDPISFKFVNQDYRKAAIYFDIVPTYSYEEEDNFKQDSSNSWSSFNNGNINGNSGHSNGSLNSQKKKKVLGRGIALLDSVYTMVGSDRRSLNNVVTIPIIESDTLEELGTVRFEVITVSSFTHPNMTYNINESYWKTLITTRVIGHRGLGKNVNSKNSLQLGENTVESFIAAASLGASYVEFDVQLTKDHVPVIYHDFLVAESGVDIPMHQLTAEQFLKLSEHRPDQEFTNHILRNSGRSQNGHGPSNGNKFAGGSLDDDVLIKNRKFRGRASSLFGDTSSVINHNNLEKNVANGIATEDQGADSLNEEDFNSVFDERMKLTKTYKEQKFKGNNRGTSIASSFVTLEDLFKKLPESVGFNIECKYPMLDEVQKEGLEQIAVDLNSWVDVVLKNVYDHKKQRNIIFSSFHPDICVLLSLKQPSIPILYLTESGTQKMADARASSLQAAIRFAKKWNLLGIVSAAAPIVQCPRLASVVKSNGLVCFTYGMLNNDPENAKLEVEAGVDAVIVDKVLAVRKGLTA